MGRRFVVDELYLVTEYLYSDPNSHEKGEAEIQDGDKYLAEFGQVMMKSSAPLSTENENKEREHMNTVQSVR